MWSRSRGIPMYYHTYLLHCGPLSFIPGCHLQLVVPSQPFWLFDIEDCDGTLLFHWQHFGLRQSIHFFVCLSNSQEPEVYGHMPTAVAVSYSYFGSVQTKSDEEEARERTSLRLPILLTLKPFCCSLMIVTKNTTQKAEQTIPQPFAVKWERRLEIKCSS